MGRGPCLGHGDREPPAVAASPPTPSRGPSDGAVEADVGGDDAAVLLGALHPGVDVVDDPGAVAVFAGDQVGPQPRVGGLEVQRIVADHVGVLLEVGQHLGEVAFAVAEAEAALDLDRIAGPVEGRGLAQERAAAAVEHGAHDAVIGVVVRGGLVGAVVHGGPAPEAALVGRVPGVAQAVEEIGGEAFAVVEPVEGDGEFLVIHAVAAHGDLDGAGLRVLSQVTLEAGAEHVQQVVGPAEGVEGGPVELVLGRVVRAVVASPPGYGQEVAGLRIEVLGEEVAAGRRLGVQDMAFEQRPARRRQGVVEAEQGRVSCRHGGPLVRRMAPGTRDMAVAGASGPRAGPARRAACGRRLGGLMLGTRWGAAGAAYGRRDP